MAYVFDVQRVACDPLHRFQQETGQRHAFTPVVCSDFLMARGKKKKKTMLISMLIILFPPSCVCLQNFYVCCFYYNIHWNIEEIEEKQQWELQDKWLRGVGDICKRNPKMVFWEIYSVNFRLKGGRIHICQLKLGDPRIFRSLLLLCWQQDSLYLLMIILSSNCKTLLGSAKCLSVNKYQLLTFSCLCKSNKGTVIQNKQISWHYVVEKRKLEQL